MPYTTKAVLALAKLREARRLLADAPNTLARVERAISSCRGAVRNAEHRDNSPARRKIHTAKARNRRTA